MQDSLSIDCAYKLVGYDGTPRRQRSEGEVLWPDAKQVFRHCNPEGRLDHDALALADEPLDGQPLLALVMREGQRLAQPGLGQRRALATASLFRLPLALRDLDRSAEYRAEVPDGLGRLAADLDA